MAGRVPFTRVLATLEEHGWEFAGFWTSYRVFGKPGRLPILVEVHDKEVTIEDFEDIMARIEREGERDEAAS
jgi:hypothetical protein